MLKSDKGDIEIVGLDSVIKAELTHLLFALQTEMGMSDREIMECVKRAREEKEKKNKKV